MTRKSDGHMLLVWMFLILWFSAGEAATYFHAYWLIVVSGVFAVAAVIALWAGFTNYVKEIRNGDK